MTLKGGGYLLIEDAHGCTRSTFLEEGFLDFLNEVLDEHDCNSCFLCAHLRCMWYRDMASTAILSVLMIYILCVGIS